MPGGIGRVERASAAHETWRRFRRHKLAVASAVLVIEVGYLLFPPLVVPVPRITEAQGIQAPSSASLQTARG